MEQSQSKESLSAQETFQAIVDVFTSSLDRSDLPTGTCSFHLEIAYLPDGYETNVSLTIERDTNIADLIWRLGEEDIFRSSAGKLIDFEKALEKALGIENLFRGKRLDWDIETFGDLDKFILEKLTQEEARNLLKAALIKPKE
jgi:hypothetical protein